MFMKISKKFLMYIVLLGTINGLIASIDPVLYPNLSRFIERYNLLLPEAECKKIEACLRGEGSVPPLVKSKPDRSWLFGGPAGRATECIKAENYWVKGSDISRVIHAVLVNACIEKNSLSGLGVARKYIGHINGAWKVLAQHTHGPTGQCFNLPADYIEQLRTLCAEAGFIDWHGENFIIANPRIVLIDTEGSAFEHGSRSLLRFALSLHNFTRSEVAIETDQNSLSYPDFCKKYGEENINFELVTQEFNALVTAQ
jgi:hypothetical protein